MGVCIVGQTCEEKEKLAPWAGFFCGEPGVLYLAFAAYE